MAIHTLQNGWFRPPRPSLRTTQGWFRSSEDSVRASVSPPRGLVRSHDAKSVMLETRSELLTALSGLLEPRPTRPLQYWVRPPKGESS